MALSVLTCTIAAGQSLSQGTDLGVGELVRMYMPPTWTPANVTFQLSPDNITYFDMFDVAGREVMIAITSGAGMVIGLQWRALAWIKIRSGTRGVPIVQAAQRDFKFIVERS